MLNSRLNKILLHKEYYCDLLVLNIISYSLSFPRPKPYPLPRPYLLPTTPTPTPTPYPRPYPSLLLSSLLPTLPTAASWTERRREIMWRRSAWVADYAIYSRPSSFVLTLYRVLNNQTGLIWIAHSWVASWLGLPSNDRPVGLYSLGSAL